VEFGAVEGVGGEARELGLRAAGRGWVLRAREEVGDELPAEVPSLLMPAIGLCMFCTIVTFVSSLQCRVLTQ